MFKRGTMARRKARAEHYVNNKEFLAALVKLREDREIAEIKGLPKPPIPRYVGECFLKIFSRISFVSSTLPKNPILRLIFDCPSFSSVESLIKD